MHKIKAELSFSASEYFQQVYELILGRADVNFDDLTGTELEQAETELRQPDRSGYRSRGRGLSRAET